MSPTWIEPARKTPLERLVLTQSFETFWAYYSLTSGAMLSQECRTTGVALCDCLDALIASDETFLSQIQSQLGVNTDANHNIQRLREWSSGESKWPNNPESWRWYFNGFLLVLKIVCLERLDSSVAPILMVSDEDRFHSQEALLWKSNLPSRVLFRGEYQDDIFPLIAKANSTPSISVVGDIRRSQDLMTYATDRDSFSTFLLRFIEGTRKLIEENDGIFDKFTGDGFIAYFNDAVCRDVNQHNDFVSNYLKFVDEESKFAADLFAEWTKTVRKIPKKGIGLAMGSDIGVVTLTHTRGHLIAVGDSIVWATRMAAEAKAGETLVNNTLYYRLQDRPNTSFKQREARTKTGEDFLARRLIITT